MEQVGQQQDIPKNMVRGEGHPPTLLFDGVCNFCDASVQFVFKHDKTRTIHFGSLQSEFGQGQLRRANLPADELKSLIFLENGKVYTRSTGALKVAKYLGMPWSWARVFLIIPRPVRDFFYDIIAQNRYRWFGEKAECMMPSPEMRARFVD